MALTKTYIVTGGNSGLGLECASVLAQDSSALVILACRDVAKGKKAAHDMRGVNGKVEVLSLDLAKQASIHAFVEAYRMSMFPPLAGLVCNAGGQNPGVPTKTADGFETTFATNHLGHYLLSRLMLLDLAQDGHITFTSSGTHDPRQKTGMPAPRYTTAETVAHDFEAGMKAGQRRYTTSKLCNLYTTYELARRFAASPDPRLQSLRVNALDPGLMPRTGLARSYPAPLRFVAKFVMPALSLFIANVHKPATSGRRLAALASGNEGSTTGKYFSDGHEMKSSTESYDEEKALDLWNWSAEKTGLPASL